jgi:hypothetical protein
VSCNVESIAKFIGEAFACSIKKYTARRARRIVLGSRTLNWGDKPG